MMDKSKSVLCIGDLVADIFTMPVDRLPSSGEAMVTEKIEFFPGGNALNSAIALCLMGHHVTIGGSIGDDAQGSFLMQQLQKIGLDTRGIRMEAGETTASTIIFRAENEDRRFLNALGVGEKFTGEYISHDLIPENGVVLIGGYLKMPAWDDDLLIAFLREARKKNNKIVLNVCVVQNSGIDPKKCLRLLEYVDIFLPNEDEARAITGKTEQVDQTRFLRQAGAKTVIITRGAKGLYADDGHTIVDMETFDVTVVDPSGCGDCFTAGLIAALSREWEIVPMLKFGSALGAIGATALGCTTAVPEFKDVQNFIEVNTLNVSVDAVKLAETGIE